MDNKELVLNGDFDTSLEGWGIHKDSVINTPYEMMPINQDLIIRWVGPKDTPFRLADRGMCEVGKSDVEGYDWQGIVKGVR